MLMSIEEIREKRGGGVQKECFFFLYIEFFNLSLIVGAKAPVKTPKIPFGGF